MLYSEYKKPQFNAPQKWGSAILFREDLCLKSFRTTISQNIGLDQLLPTSQWLCTTKQFLCRPELTILSPCRVNSQIGLGIGTLQTVASVACHSICLGRCDCPGCLCSPIYVAATWHRGGALSYGHRVEDVPQIPNLAPRQGFGKPWAIWSQDSFICNNQNERYWKLSGSKETRVII